VAFAFLAKASCDFVVLCGEWKKAEPPREQRQHEGALRRVASRVEPARFKLKDIASLTDAFSEPVASREGQEDLEVGLRAGNRSWAHSY
jgi:hypothetical protein